MSDKQNITADHLLEKKANEHYLSSTNGFGASTFGLDGIPFVRRKAIIELMEEYAALKMRKAAEDSFGEGWDRCLSSPIAWKDSEREKYIDNYYPKSTSV